MNPEQASTVLDMLVAEGKVEQEVVDALAKKCPTSEMKRCADILHKLLCKNDHNAGACEYYEEDQLEGCWAREDHARWLDESITVMEKLELTTEGELKNAVAAVNAAIGKAGQTSGAVELLLLTLGS